MHECAARALPITLLVLFACGDTDFPGSDPETTATADNVGGSSTASVTTTTDGAGGSTAATTAGTGGDGASPPSGITDVGTLVVLGDSISDGGGEGPFYYDLLHERLETHYGAAIGYENHAQAGTTTMFLAGQLDQVPVELAGPVVVVITSGGNNMQYNVVQILTGLDQMARDRMAGHIDAVLSDLLAPDRFGAGVDVRVFEANIYDASDGAGDFGANGCAMPIDAPNGSAGFFANWNAAIEQQVSIHGQHLVDLHGHFTGHGFHTPPSWYAADCIHPNATGHGEISELIFASIIGT